MFKFLPGLPPRARHMIRVGYVVLLIGLIVYAMLLQRQLRGLRERPVVLPAYLLYVVDRPEKASAIQAMGSWVTTGLPPANAVQTVSIECKRAKMQCVESISVVALDERPYLESMPVIYEVDQWTDAELATKPTSTACSDRVIRINFEQRKAMLAATPTAGAKSCPDLMGNYSLESGATLLQQANPH